MALRKEPTQCDGSLVSKVEALEGGCPSIGDVDTSPLKAFILGSIFGSIAECESGEDPTCKMLEIVVCCGWTRTYNNAHLAPFLRARRTYRCKIRDILGRPLSHVIAVSEVTPSVMVTALESNTVV